MTNRLTPKKHDKMGKKLYYYVYDNFLIQIKKLTHLHSSVNLPNKVGA